MSIPILASDSSYSLVRPKNDLDPKYKQNDPKYSLDMAKYIYSSYRMGRTGIKPDDIDLIELCRRYASGRQDPNKYKKIFLGDESPNGVIPLDDVNNGTATVRNQREGWVDMDFEHIFSPLPKYMMNIIGMMETQEHDIFCEAQDEKSINEKEDLKYTALVNARHKELTDYVREKLGLPQSDQTLLPTNMQELSMFESMGAFKLPYEMAMERLLNHTQYVSEYKKIKRRIIYDLVSINKSATMSYTDPITGVVKDKWIDIEDLIIEDSVQEDFKDSTYAAIPENITIVDLRAQNPNIPEEELEGLAKRYLGVMGNPNVLGNIQSTAKTNIYSPAVANYAYNDIRVPVLHCVWKTTDSEYYTIRKNTEGKEIEVYEPYRGDGTVAPKTYNTDKRKTTRTDIRTIYQCRWVIGTDFVYDYGRLHNISFDFKTKEALLPVHVFRLPGRSIIDNAMVLADQLQMAFLRLQNAIAKSPPPGIAVEFGSLENMAFDGKKWSPLDIIKLRSQTGNYIYRQVSPIPGQPITQNKPFEELRGGLGTAVADALQTFELIYTQLSEVTGVDRLSAVSKSPTADQGVGVTELAVSATSNTLRPIYTGYVTIKENQSRCDAMMLQAVIQTPEGEEVYKKIIGSSMVDAIKVAGNYPPAEWGFKIIAQPDDAMKNEVRQAAMGAMAGGKNGIPALTYSDYLFIVEHLNTGAGIKYARAFIAYKEGERDKQASQMAQANVQNQTQSQMQLEQLKIKSELLKIQAQLDADKERITLEAAMKTATDQAQFVMQQELLNTQRQLSPQEQMQGSPQGIPQGQPTEEPAHELTHPKTGGKVKMSRREIAARLMQKNPGQQITEEDINEVVRRHL